MPQVLKSGANTKYNNLKMGEATHFRLFSINLSAEIVVQDELTNANLGLARLFGDQLPDCQNERDPYDSLLRFVRQNFCEVNRKKYQKPNLI